MNRNWVSGWSAKSAPHFRTPRIHAFRRRRSKKEKLTISIYFNGFFRPAILSDRKQIRFTMNFDGRHICRTFFARQTFERAENARELTCMTLSYAKLRWISIRSSIVNQSGNRVFFFNYWLSNIPSNRPPGISKAPWNHLIYFDSRFVPSTICPHSSNHGPSHSPGSRPIDN